MADARSELEELRRLEELEKKAAGQAQPEKAPVESPEGAAFGVFPKQRAVPSRTKIEETPLGAAGLGAKTAMMEPVYGAGELIPGEIGKASARAGKELEQEYQKKAKQFPVATRAGYLPTLLGTAAIPGAGGVRLAEGAGLLGRAAAGGGVGGAVMGALQPTGQEDYAKRAEEKAKSAAVGGTLGTALGVAVPGAAKLAKAFKKPEPIATPSDFEQLGRKVEQSVSGPRKEFIEARRAEAKQTYDSAKKIAREKQTAGIPFGDSPEGRQLAQELEASKYADGFLKSETEIKAIDDVLNVLRPRVTGGEAVPVGKGKVSARLETKTPTVKTEKDISAFIDELRSIRDANKPGQPVTNYAGLTREYRKNLIEKIEKYLYEWSPEYRQADEAYKAASDKLAPFETDLMRRLLKEEKYAAGDIARDTEKFAKDFFSSADTVNQLKNATQDPALVAQLGKEYIATLFSNKSPAQVKSIATDPANVGWMREAGILSDVQNYANKASTAENRQKIAKLLGTTALGGAVGYTAGSRISKMLGL